MTHSVAVAVRTHFTNEKVVDLVREVGAGAGYDGYVLADETNGPLDLTDLPKLDCSLDRIRALGFDAQDSHFTWLCGDLIFSLFQQAAPGYAHYVMVEHDVHVQTPGFLDRLAAALDGADLVGPRFRRPPATWPWHPAAARAYPEVFGVFYPLVALSNRAIPFLLEQRRLEDPADRMSCEALTASALMQGGFRCLDLNDVVPGAYAWDGFNIGPPRPFGSMGPVDGQVVHPVLTGAQYEIKVAKWAAFIAAERSKSGQPTEVAVPPEDRPVD